MMKFDFTIMQQIADHRSAIFSWTVELPTEVAWTLVTLGLAGLFGWLWCQKRRPGQEPR